MMKPNFTNMTEFEDKMFDRKLQKKDLSVLNNLISAQIDQGDMLELAI